MTFRLAFAWRLSRRGRGWGFLLQLCGRAAPRVCKMECPLLASFRRFPYPRCSVVVRECGLNGGSSPNKTVPACPGPGRMICPEPWGPGALGGGALRARGSDLWIHRYCAADSRRAATSLTNADGNREGSWFPFALPYPRFDPVGSGRTGVFAKPDPKETVSPSSLSPLAVLTGCMRGQPSVRFPSEGPIGEAGDVDTDGAGSR